MNKVDFSIDEFFKDFGGKEVAKEKYPAMYNAVLKTEKNLLNNKVLESSDDAKNIGFNMGAIRMENTPNLNSYLKESPTNAQDNRSVICDSSATVNKATMIMVTSEMIDTTNGVMIDSDSSYIEHTDLTSTILSKVSEIGEFNDHKISATSKYYYVYPDGTCGTSNIETANYTIVNGQSCVTDFVVDDPKIKSENVSNKHVNILYDRSPKDGEKTDYYYTGSDIEVSGNKVKTVVPVSGYFKLSNILEPKGLSSVIGLQLVYKEETVVEYSYDSIEELNNYFSHEKDTTDNCYKVKFNFDKDWRAYLDKSKYYDGTYITDCKLRWSFRYDCYMIDSSGNKMKDSDGNDIIFELGLCINSESSVPSGGEYNKSTSNKVVVPDLYIQWGCFHKDTIIKMADGSRKKISEINIGDFVEDCDKSKVEVTEVYRGNEEKLICIETEKGKKLKVTENHPVKTDIGMIKASNLVITAIVHTEDGPEKIENISVIDYDDLSYNIDCNGAVIIADGIFSGDFICQNKNEKTKQNTKYSEETLAIMEDLKKMSEDFKNRKIKHINL